MLFRSLANEGQGIERYEAIGTMTVPTVLESTDLEEFMSDFEPEYRLWDFFDSENEYTKPVRLAQTTPNGTVILLDKVMVTEDNISVSLLVGTDKLKKDQKLLKGFEIGSAWIDVGPVLPYPPEFETSKLHGGGGGGEPGINDVNEEPLVVMNMVSNSLMKREGYVSPKDPIQVRVTVRDVQTCWEDKESYSEYWTYRCFSEEGPWVFEFETDGSELAELTKDVAINKTISINGHDLTMKSLRFNPIQPILFMSGFNDQFSPELNNSHVFLEADDGTQLKLYDRMFTYTGFTQVHVNEADNDSFEKTEKVKISFCLSKMWEIYPEDYDPMNMTFYDCDPAWSTVVDVR